MSYGRHVLVRWLAIGLGILLTAGFLTVLPATSWLGRSAAAHASVPSGSTVYTIRNSTTDSVVLRNTSGTVTTLATLDAGSTMGHPVVSPDGSKVAFTVMACDIPSEGHACSSDPIGQSVVTAVVNTDGSGETELSFGTSTNQVIDWFPTWSSDSNWIAYVRVNGASSDLGLWKIHPDGSGATQVVADTNASSDFDNLSWSPNGAKFAMDRPDSFGKMVLYYMNADGSGATQIPSQPSQGMGDNTEPAWAPNSSRVYFQNLQWGASEIEGINLDGTSLVQETASSYSGTQEPSVSPDGNTLVVSPGPSYSDLFTVPTSGTQTQTTLTGDGSTYIHEWPSYVSSTFPTSSAKTLVALGDSVAAGEGINYGWAWDSTNSQWTETGPSSPSWTDTTTASGSNYQGCHQSDQPYDRLLYAKNYNVFNMACTGASAMSGILKSGTAGGASYPAELGGNCSGCDSANTYYDAHNPDVVTLTLGADDITFADWVKSCYGGTSACNTSANTTTLNSQLSSEETNLRLTLNELNRRAGLASKNVRVIVTNYYNPFPSTYTSCIDTSASSLVTWYSWIGITSAEQTWLVNGLNSLNSNISSEVTYAQSHDAHLTVRLADVSSAMLGHQFCDSAPWVYGPSIDYPSSAAPTGTNNPAPFHPTPAGQAAISQIVASKLTG